MKTFSKLALAVLASFALAAAAFACDKEGTDKTAAKAGGCPHAAAAAAKAEGGCPHAAALAAKAEGGCAHQAADTASADKDAGCSHGAAASAVLAKYADEAGGCPMHSKATEAQRAALLKGEKITLTGYVVCASCDLKAEKACRSVFKAEDGQLYAIVGNDAFEKLAAVTMHGEKRVEIIGTTAKDAGQPLVLLSSYKLVG